MDLLIEFIFELLFEGSIEITKSKKESKWIRYPLIVLLSFFILAIILLIAFLGIKILLSDKSYSIFCGLFLIMIDIIFIVSIVKTINKEKEKLK